MKSFRGQVKPLLKLKYSSDYYFKSRMGDKKINKKSSYTINLVEIGGKGDFKCPGCGVKISPDDKTEETYIILEPVMKKDSLQKLLIQCNNCKSNINLLGFEQLK